jgi:hypothetical protein
MRVLLLCLCASLSLFSCKKEDVDAGSSSGDIFIRVSNASPYQFNNIEVKAPGGEHTYGAVAAGQKSAYKQFTKAYRYAYIKLAAQGQDLVLQPFDYVGETPLPPGQYTYVLEVVTGNQNQNQLTIRLEKP